MPHASRRDSRPSEAQDIIQSPVFDLELDCEEETLPASLSRKQFERLKTELKGLVRPLREELEICRDVEGSATLTMREEGMMDLVVLASRLSSLGYIPVLRTAPGGGHGVDCFRNLHHSFICLHTEAEDDGRHIFVDPSFKEQFTLQPRLAWYQSLLDLVPDVFVGHQDRIRPIVQLLTYAMALAFSEQGCAIPPWRSGAALLSKWLPRQGIDQRVGSIVAPFQASVARIHALPIPPACCAQANPRKIHNIKPLLSHREGFLL